MSSENFIDKVHLLVNVGNRIITYKSLSQEFQIHVNKAKQYLLEYYNNQKSLGMELEVNYFLAGFVEMNGLRSVRALVVSGDHVEEAKDSFTELTSCHIYSVLKGVSKDEHALYSCDYSCTQNEDRNKYSAIKHPNIELKPPILTKMPPIQDIKSIPKKVESNTVSNGKSTSDCKDVVNAKKKSPKKDDAVRDKQDKNLKENKPEAKSGTLMSMWSKKDQPNSVKNENSKSESKAKATKTVPKNNILTMFSKQAVKNSEKPPASNPVSKDLKSCPKSNSPVNQSSKEVTPSELRKHSQKRKLSRNKKSNSSKTQHNSDSDSECKTKPKKHRRICTFDSDSESEPEEEKEKAQRSFFLSEEPMETSAATPASDDSEEPIPPTPPVIRVKGKAKVWKTVKKTYEDEEGFFVTKSEKELVSASEDEEDPLKSTKDKKKETLEQKSPPKQNKKQASLMSFFKQK